MDKLELPGTLVKKYNNELYTLRNLANGLEFLYEQVDKVEKSLIGPVQGKLKLVFAGNIPHLPKKTLAFVTCAFHWYAVSVCNYVWLVGWLAHRADKNQRKPQKYANDMIPAVVTYRNKVAAHLSTLEPRDDNPADLEATLLFPLTLNDDGFYVGGWDITTTKNGHSSQSKHDIKWSLTKIHTQLAKRYWPQSEI